MAELVKVKKWGNSFGVVIPKKMADDLRIKHNEIVSIEVQKSENILRDLFGKLKFKEPTEKILKDVRKDIESKWE